MTKHELLGIASQGYADNLVPLYDRQTGVVSEEHSGDTLALFVVRELMDTLAEGQDDAVTLQTAARRMRTAAEELSDVAQALEGQLSTLL